MQVWGTDTVDKVKERLTELGIDVSAWPDAKIESIILEAQRQFENATHREFETATTIRKLNGTGKNLMVLPFIPVQSIEYINVLYSDNVAPLTVTGYRLKEETGELVLTGLYPFYSDVWPEGIANIEVKWIHGYDVANIPQDIVDAMILASTIEIIQRDPRDWESEGLVSVKIGDYSESYGAGDYYGGAYGRQIKRWDERIKLTIAKYRRTIIL